MMATERLDLTLRLKRFLKSLAKRSEKSLMKIRTKIPILSLPENAIMSYKIPVSRYISWVIEITGLHSKRWVKFS